MPSKELNQELQNTINQYTANARESFQKKDLEGFKKWQMQKWDLIPEPKTDWEESYRIAKVLITYYIKYSINFEEANRWLDKLSFLDDKQQQHPGELQLMTGKIRFEEKNFDEALKAFKSAYAESEGHCFGSGDDIYLDFYRNPEKYKNL